MPGVEEQAQQLVEAAAAAYADQPGTEVVMVPGQIIVNDFCWAVCGSVFVRLDSAFSSTNFPNPNLAVAPCGSPLAVRWHLGVARCVAGPDKDGNPPPAAEQAADALQIVGDMVRLREMLCGLDFGRGNSLLGAWQPYGPAGNCAGGWWPLTWRVTR